METATLAGIFVTGFAYGSSACLFSCTPALMPLLIHRGDRLDASLRTLAIFGAGRIVAYTLIAALAGIAAERLRNFLDHPPFTRLLVGIVMIATGVWLLYRLWYPAPKRCGISSRRPIEPSGEMGIFLMGMGLSLNLCPPLIWLITLSSATGKPLVGALYGMIFGLGSVAVMWMIYGAIFAPVIREMLRQFQRFKVSLQALSSLTLLGVGVLVVTDRVTL
ncbi:urease accessory protein UreH domain-containing protein [Nitratifractor sp.]